MTDTFDKRSTHSQVSINECAVVSVKVVSACKEARSAHVEILKVDVQDEGRKERTAPKSQSRHEAKACLCLFLQKRKHMPGLFRLSNLLKVLLVFVIPRLFTVFGEWARLSSVLVLYGTCRAHNARMKSFVSAERAYWTVP